VTAALAIIAAVLTALIAALRLAAERRARVEAEQRTAALRARIAETEQAQFAAHSYQQNWVAVLSHELRSPIAAIIGYGELLADGLLGELDDRGRDAVARINHAAGQILRLTEGIEQLALDPVTDTHPPELVSSGELLEAAAATLRFDAEARGTTIVVAGHDFPLHIRRENAARALALALGAAVKASAGRTIRLSVTGPETAPTFVIAGTRLDAAADDPDSVGAGRLTGAGFRIALARMAAAAAGGTVMLAPSVDGTELRLELSSGLIDEAEHRP
jgi:signal transduction histidine kinase